MASKAKRSPRTQASGDGDAEAGPKIDEVLQRLEGVVEALEGGDLPLEQALARFEEGVRLARQGGALLDDIEQRVEVLLADGRGQTRTVPFDEDSETDQDDEEDDDGEF